jgi:hypothetical protein
MGLQNIMGDRSKPGKGGVPERGAAIGKGAETLRTPIVQATGIGFAGIPAGITIASRLYAKTIVKERPEGDEEVRLILRDQSGTMHFEIGPDGRLENLHGVRFEISDDGKPVARGSSESPSGYLVGPDEATAEIPSGSVPRIRPWEVAQALEVGFDTISPEALRVCHKAIKREADRIQFQALADRRDHWKAEHPDISAQALQMLLDQDAHYQSLRVEKERLRQLQNAIENLLDPPGTGESTSSRKQAATRIASGDPHGRGRPRRKSSWQEGVRGNAWLLAIGGVIAGLLGGSIGEPTVLDHLSRSVRSPEPLPSDFRAWLIERVEFPALWVPEALFHLARQLPPDSPVLQSSPEALQQYLSEHGLVQSEVALLIIYVMGDGEKCVGMRRVNVYQECHLITPLRTLILDVVAGQSPSSMFVGVLSSQAVDDLEKLQLPPEDKKRFSQELLKMVE